MNATEPNYVVLQAPEGSLQPVTMSDDNPPRVIVSMGLSTGMFNALAGLAKESGAGIEDVISKAFLLYKAAADAHREGKAVGIAPTADALESEFVGF